MNDETDMPDINQIYKEATHKAAQVINEYTHKNCMRLNVFIDLVNKSAKSKEEKFNKTTFYAFMREPEKATRKTYEDVVKVLINGYIKNNPASLQDDYLNFVKEHNLTRQAFSDMSGVCLNPLTRIKQGLSIKRENADKVIKFMRNYEGKND